MKLIDPLPIGIELLEPWLILLSVSGCVEVDGAEAISQSFKLFLKGSIMVQSSVFKVADKS